MTIATDKDLKLVQEINLLGGSRALNIFYLRTDFQVPQDEDDVLATCETYIEALFGEILPQVVSGVTLGTLYVYQYDSISLEWDIVGNRSPSVTFTAVGDMLPHGVACMSRAYTALGRTIGRKYLAGFDEDTSVDGAWSAGCLADVVAFNVVWGQVVAISSGNDLIPGVWTTRLSYVVSLTGTFVILADAAYQRRRRPGVGT